MIPRQCLWTAALILISGGLHAQDIWLIPDFASQPGQRMKIRAYQGTAFPIGGSAIAPDLITRFALYGASGKTDAAGIRPLEGWTEAEVAVEAPGSHVVTLETRPQPRQFDPGEFSEHLTREGLTSILELRANKKQETQPARMLHADLAKTVVIAGSGTADTATSPVGMKLELVPLKNPDLVLPGEKIPIRVLFDGKPLPHAQVSALSENFPAGDRDDGDPGYKTRTSYEGIAYVSILAPGTWMLRLIHVIPADEGADHEWESFSSTLTFRIPPERGFPLTVDSIMRGPDLVGYGIDALRWSGDSQRLYFEWRRPGERESHTYVLSRADSSLKRLTEEEARGVIPERGRYTKDHRRMVFAENGDIIFQDAVSNERRKLTSTTETEASPRFTQDEKHVTFVRDNNLYRVSLETSEIVQLTDFRTGQPPQEPRTTESQKLLAEQQRNLFEVVRERADEREVTETRRKEREKRKPYYIPRGARISDLELSPDQGRVFFTQLERAEQARTAAVPNYVTDSGYTEDISARAKVGDVQDSSKAGLAAVETGEIIWIDPGQKDRPVGISGANWSEEGANLVVTAIAQDNKDLWHLRVDLATGETTALHNLHDEAWVMGRGASSSVGWMPDGRGIYFISEKEGYFQLYTAPLEGGDVRALTSGKFEVFDTSLSRDKSLFYFTSSEVHPGERHFYSMAAAGGARTQVTTMTGNHRVLLSPDERTAAVIYSCSNQPPELYLMENRPGAEAKRITHTPTEEWRSFPWVEPQLITFNAADGAAVYARVYTPEMLERAPEKPSGAAHRPQRGTAAPASRRPAVIFVHGAGYAQNAHRYWSSYYREYMFHHILIKRGFVVMDIDYRGSSGYGRDWRTAIYRHMGGRDLDDQVDGARWMVENLNVDPKRIGIYGGSYGGFITLMAMFTRPEVFSAGAALRPVTDWAHYNHPYTANILNQPQDDGESYLRSSPIYFAEGLRGALLICHGMVDTNVHFQDTVRLTERLIQLRKENWETAIFPVENHGFQRSDSWVDEYKRILKLFESNLKPAR